MSDYQKLGLGNSTSLVTSVRIEAWGSKFILDCLYDPAQNRQPYMLTFYECRQIQWDIFDQSNVPDTEADLIGLSLGENDYAKTAVIHTDIFEISLEYRRFELAKDWLVETNTPAYALPGS